MFQKLKEFFFGKPVTAEPAPEAPYKLEPPAVSPAPEVKSGGEWPFPTPVAEIKKPRAKQTAKKTADPKPVEKAPRKPRAKKATN